MFFLLFFCEIRKSFISSNFVLNLMRSHKIVYVRVKGCLLQVNNNDVKVFTFYSRLVVTWNLMYLSNNNKKHKQIVERSIILIFPAAALLLMTHRSFQKVFSLSFFLLEFSLYSETEMCFVKTKRNNNNRRPTDFMAHQKYFCCNTLFVEYIYSKVLQWKRALLKVEFWKASGRERNACVNICTHCVKIAAMATATDA